MIVESYSHLLKLKHFDNLYVDTYALLLGYINKTWTVFYGFIFLHDYMRGHLIEVKEILNKFRTRIILLTIKRIDQAEIVFSNSCLNTE